ncbi:MAG: 3-dehydroquinate synthase [Treponematales bacterium]
MAAIPPDTRSPAPSNGAGTFAFRFGARETTARITAGLPALADILAASGCGRGAGVLAVCDTNTRRFAERIAGGAAALCVLESGEEAKSWASVERILAAARGAGLGRDGLFVGVGGGVVGDLTAFAASVYMRGAGLCLVPTTLLAMADAALGGKTGFDLFGVKNLAGTFYPARAVFMPLESLESLPPREWKSGTAEVIKAAVIGDSRFLRESAGLARLARGEADRDALFACVSMAAAVKGRIVEADPEETGGGRALLNLGHTFGHALEASAGLGRLSHGEAVAWGMARACELGEALGLTPPERAGAIAALLVEAGYETRAPHPLMGSAGAFMAALGADKKRRAGLPRFVVPLAEGAALVSEEDAPLLRGPEGAALVERIVGGK